MGVYRSPLSGYFRGFPKFLVILLVLLPPNFYPAGYCWRIANDFQEELGGEVVIYFPVQPNGAYDFSKKGHALNHRIIDENEYFLDWKEQRIMNKAEYKQWIMERYYYHDMSEGQYDVMRSTWVSLDRPPFSIIWY